MQLENTTPYPAALYRGVIAEDRLCASLVARVTYDVAPDGRLVPAAEQAWPVSGGPWESPYGLMPGDELFYRGGVDLFAFGSARAPGGRPVPRVDVTVEVGPDFRAGVAVFGPRQWVRGGGTLVPSAPAPFEECPLTLAHAYGGAGEWDLLPIPYQDNPQGAGYHLEAGQAEGRPLPNIEDPAALLARWDDRPEPVGVGPAPMSFGPRLRRALVLDDATGEITRIDPTFFNAAFPALVAPRAALAGPTWVRVTGMTPDAPLAFWLPPTSLRVRLRFGDDLTELAPPVDQVGVEVDARRVFVTYRYPFRYRFTPLQLRACTLAAAGAGGAA